MERTHVRCYGKMRADGAHPQTGRTERALRTPQSEFRMGNGLFSRIHFGMDDWGFGCLNYIRKANQFRQIMQAYKNQRYLPAAYLKQFSADKNAKLTRKSQIWRFDGKKSTLVSAESQCCENYHYSSEQAAAVEKMFGSAEGCFAECASRIRNGKPPADGQFFGLIWIIFDLHLRNAAYDNLTGKNNLHAYNLRFYGLKKLLIGRKSEPTDKEFLIHMRKRWRVRVLSTSNGNEFITSDNPSVLIAAPGTIPDLQLVVLPITPTHMAIAYDCQQIEVVGEKTTPMDEELLNQLQLFHAERCVFSSVQLNTEQQQFVAERLNCKTKVRCKTDETAWEASMQRLEPDSKFSVVRPVITQ